MQFLLHDYYILLITRLLLCYLPYIFNPEKYREQISDASYETKGISSIPVSAVYRTKVNAADRKERAAPTHVHSPSLLPLPVISAILTVNKQESVCLCRKRRSLTLP